MQKYPKVAAVILNYNGQKWLEKFLPFVKKSTYPNLDIIVGDNASKDDSVSYMKQHHPEIRLIINEHNGGYTKGYNDCLKQVIADYYILLNSDIETPEHWIEPVIDLMESDKTIAACQPKIKYYSDKDYFEYAGASGGYMDKFGYPFCRGRIFETLEKDEGQYNSIEEVFWATGACLFVRADIYWQMNGLYEHLFAHMEEIDLCWRMKRAGYKVMVCPQSEVYHVGGGTLHKSNPRKTYYNFRNNLILLYRNLKGPFLFYIILMRLVLDGIAAVKYLISGEGGNFKAVFRAHMHFYKWNLKYNETIDKPEVENNKQLTGTYNKSIIWDYFAKGKKHYKDLKM